MNQAHEFGLALRQARERRGITVDEVVDETKVSAALLLGLERGDLSRWPAGIFRRAFVRSYAETIGLDPDAVLAEFLRVYPEGGGDAAVRAGLDEPAGAHADALRLTLASGWAWQPSSRRLLGAGLDVVAAAVISAAVLWGAASWGASAAPLTAAAVVCYYVAAHLAWGTSLGVRLASRRGGVRRRPAAVQESLGLSASEPPPARVVPADPRVPRTRADRRRASRAERGSSRPVRR